ncbi:MAG: hypothetical protein A2219_00585 [Elusimicrobia bacterium RIFOXYA2_FULL_50_26]|nr:MAG: hypothetical protein A2219_00585 [Elusimicrobia bacterium RIFOXYA2_FULL_50_26]OGS25256.1 MAG: hypothetical protein A2314_09620 [Elusimicrobia bacterium RIFOXYB2_FULL_50_12]
MHVTALRLPDTLELEVEKVAEQLQRTKSYVIRKAVETYVREYANYQIALGRLNDKDDDIISSKEMRALVEKKHPVQKVGK